MKEDDLKQEYVDVLEELDWNFCVLDNCVEISQYTSAGEDFSFTVGIENFRQNVSEYACDFDPCDHAEMWVAARGSVSGIPDIETLLEDAKELGENLMTLAQKLAQVE